MTTPDVTLLPCPDCGGQGINTDTLGTKTAVCRKCKGSGRTPAAAPDGLVERVALAIVNDELAQIDLPPLKDVSEFRNQSDRDSYLRAARAAIAAMPDHAALKDTQP